MRITEGMIKKLCSATIYKRGTEYFGAGRVHMRKRAENAVSAVVDGEELYCVDIKFGETGIDTALCTCPYFETMHSTCKHIVAVLEQCRIEADEGTPNGANDEIAASLCAGFADVQEKLCLRAMFTLYIKPSDNAYPTFEMSVSLPEYGGELGEPESFLDCYLRGTEYKLNRTAVYTRDTMAFPETEDKIIAVLAEVYETHSAGTALYRRESEKMSFGASALRRILPLLANLNFKLVHDGEVTVNARIIREDPDILIDVSTYGREISLTVSDRGFALTPDGEWFLYNGIIYHTSADWRGYFMPIYRALNKSKRTQVTFSGDNTIGFAALVLPKLRGKHGVVITGVEEIVVHSKPDFEIYLDFIGRNVTAVVAAVYGDIKFRIPTKSPDMNGKIIIRRPDDENAMLSLFNKFDRERSVFTLSDDVEIYDFVTRELDVLKEHANVIMTERFQRLIAHDDVDLKINAAYRRDINFLEIGFESDLSKADIAGILSAIHDHADFYRLLDGTYLNIKSGLGLRTARMLERLDITERDLDAKKKLIPAYHMPYMATLDWIDKDKSIIDYMKELADERAVVPEELIGVLRPYQTDGVKWFTELAKAGMGGILADDMGLGKTLQVLAFIHGIRPSSPVLIVAPSTLTYNWQREINKFIPDAPSLIINGSMAARRELIKTIANYEFVITSYTLLRNDIALYRDKTFEYCVIDEAQYIKNPKTVNAFCVKRIRAKHKFALTGTPIENSLTELWSIFDFVMPGYLKTERDFRARYEIPSVRGGDGSATERLRAIIRPFVLRRMKKDVLDELPEKIETTMMCDLTLEQKALYLAYLSDAQSKIRGTFHEQGGSVIILTLLLRLRQICCHPRMFDADYNGESGKLDLLRELIESGLGSGHRILIFSQFRTMLDIIAELLQKKCIDYFCIHGATPAWERSDYAERFNRGERNVFLVSLKAGGTGLNLTGADMVIHYDPWWNPAVTDQATDRAYRIGQTNSVQVIKLVTRGTIEEKIMQLQTKKRQLADDIIRVNNDTLASLSEDEIMSLFEL